MTWVKVCGLTTASDLAAAVRAGADALGLNNIPASERYVEIDDAVRLAAVTPVTTVLLTVDMTPRYLLSILKNSQIGGVQPYGEHRWAAANAAVDAGYLVLFPTKPEPGLRSDAIPGIPLLDTPSTTKLGGTGRVFDWSVAKDFDGDFVLAGGLGPDNVQEAIAQVQPWGVDASSRLERAPGRKDHSIVADFITKAKTASSQQG